jgi:branched-subunit amino acid aminotransferase/4-amino-4-deoxychorismate lyase
MIDVGQMLAYVDGKLMSEAEAKLPLFDAGVALGVSVSEMLRTFGLRAYRLEDHLDRLLHSLELAGIEAPFGKEALAGQILELVRRNGALQPPGEELGVSVFVTGGDVATYRHMAGASAHGPRCYVYTYRLVLEDYAERMVSGARLVTPSVLQLPQACVPRALKCRSRMHYWLAEKEARKKDPMATALLLDDGERVTETATANLLVVAKGEIISPCESMILPGVSRKVVIELAGRLRIPFWERDIHIADIKGADEAILTSTPFCAMAATFLDGEPIGDGKPGPVYRRLMAAWNEDVGLDIAEQVQAKARTSGVGR